MDKWKECKWRFDSDADARTAISAAALNNDSFLIIHNGLVKHARKIGAARFVSECVGPNHYQVKLRLVTRYHREPIVAANPFGIPLQVIPETIYAATV